MCARIASRAVTMMALALALVGAALDRSWAQSAPVLEASGPQGTPASQIAVEGSTLYVASADRLATFDIDDPARPVFLGQSPSLGADVRSVSIGGTIAAVVLTGGGLRVLDISDPHRLAEVARYATPITTAGVAVSGHLVLVPAGSVVTILDVSTPSQSSLVGSYQSPAEVRGVTAAGRYGYVVTADSSLRLVDLSDPKRPIEVGATRIEGAGSLSPVAMANANAFGTFIFGHYTASMVIDVADPTRPERRADANPSLYTSAGAFALQGDVLYAANRGLLGFGSVGAVNIASSGSPTQIGSLEARWDPLAIAVRGTWAYVLGGDGLLHVLDVANPASMRLAGVARLGPLPTPPDVPHDERYFGETGYRIEDDAVWDYFTQRGGLDTFGYPVSRGFTLLGCPVQMFQREIAQHCAGTGVQLLNLLDPDLFAYTQANFSTFPAADASLKAGTPRPDQADYASAIIEFVAANAPDTWQGRPVDFGGTFLSLITPDMAGTDDPGILALLNLEVWGAPISRPAADPHNPEFIYQRFQRGVMHFDATTGITRGILLADYLKAILRGTELPADLREQAVGSRLFAQYCPQAPAWLCRPDDLPATDLTFAFAQS